MDQAVFLMSAGRPIMTTGRPCWLAQHDPEERECEGKLEAFHFVGRQRVRNALGALLGKPTAFGPIETTAWLMSNLDPAELIQLAEWDPRNAGPGCEMHHRRLDAHRMPVLEVPYEALPQQVISFAEDWGLETSLEEKYIRRGS